MEALDFTQLPVVDNHCHGIVRDQAFEDIRGWRQAFTESNDSGMARDHVASTAFYRRLIRTLADFLECEPEEEAVFAARTRRDGRELTGALLRAANIDTLLLDTGFPPPEKVLPVPELGELGGCRTEPMLRLEILMEGLLAEHDSLEKREEALAAELDDVRGQGYVALKSIAAYRTGLDIQEWPREEAEGIVPRIQAGRQGGPRAPRPQAASRHPATRGVRAGGPARGPGPVSRRLRRRGHRPPARQPTLPAPGASAARLSRHARRAAARVLPVHQAGRLPGRRLRERLPRPLLRHPAARLRRDALLHAAGARRRPELQARCTAPTA